MTRLGAAEDPTVRLEPVPLDVARAVVHGDGALPARRAPDWPHPDTADALRPLADHPEAGGEGTFLVLENDVVVGECGWFGPPVDGETAIGFGLARSACGRGVGTEAVRQLLLWLAPQGVTKVRAEVLPGNEASLRLLARLGFAAAGETGGHRQLVRALSVAAPGAGQGT